MVDRITEKRLNTLKAFLLILNRIDFITISEINEIENNLSGVYKDKINQNK